MAEIEKMAVRIGRDMARVMGVPYVRLFDRSSAAQDARLKVRIQLRTHFPKAHRNVIYKAVQAVLEP